MDRRPQLLFTAATLLLLPSACATRYDSRTVDERTLELYGAHDASAEDRSPTSAPDLAAELLVEADLDRYVAFGLHSSARLRAAFETWRASTERVQLASTLPDPMLSFGEFIEGVQTRTGPQRRRFGLSQAFPWPGELDSRADVATRRAEAAWQGVEQVRLEVARRIEVAFHEYAYLARELEITDELLGLIRGLEPVVQGRIRAGAGQEDLLRLQVEIGRLEDDLGSIQRRRPVLSARLADAMNVPLESAAALPWPRLDVPEATDRRSDDLIAAALASSPRLRALEQELAAAQSAEELSGFRRRPDFSARIDYIQTGDASNSQTPGSGDDPLLVGLSLSLPVWTASYSAAEREAGHLVKAARARLDGARSTLHADVTEEAYRVDDAQRRIRLYQESLIPRARESLQLTAVSYRSGRSTVLDLLDSERALLEFELSLWRACAEYLVGEARLTELLGGAVR